MKTKSDIKLAICIVSFGLPIVFIGRGQWELGLAGTLAFLLIYSFLPFCKNIRKSIRLLDAYVYGSYASVLIGCWLLYSNGHDQAASFWLYLLVAALGFPMFKKLEKHFTDQK